MTDADAPEVSRREKLDALADITQYNTLFSGLIIVLGLSAAVFEGIGVGFILPVIELLQSDTTAANADGLLRVFVSIYQTLGFPFTLPTVIVGVAIVMTVRYSLSFVLAWSRAILRMHYTRTLKQRGFENALSARLSYYDEKGSDEILNAIVTQTKYGGTVIVLVVKFVEQAFLSIVYLGVALYIAPVLTLVTVVFLGGVTVLTRSVFEPGYELGELVAEANEQQQTVAQAGTQGIRDIRLFGLPGEFLSRFVTAVDKQVTNQIKLERNQAAIENFYNLVVAVSVFVLIYIALRFADLSFGQLGVFLFAMFRLAPRASTLNRLLYKIENNLPHLVRTHRFIEELVQEREPAGGQTEPPADIEQIEFDDVRFAYSDDDPVLRGIDFTIDGGEFVAFVGQSGAGKSTIVSLLSRVYEYDEGSIRINGEPIESFPNDGWREKISIVRQNPYIFNETLWYNLTIGNRDVDEATVDEVCEIARVSEFTDDLRDGYQTVLGDDGVQLSGGQRQRVALARALLRDSELLILDEATSDLDTRLEREVQQNIEQMAEDYTIITIAHRLSTVRNADRIYTLEDGRVAEDGEHAELIERDSSYAELYRTQQRR